MYVCGDLMKKVLFSLLIVLIFPMVVMAESVVVTDAYMSIDIAEDWYVFTRDKLDGIEDFGITEEEMLEFFKEYNVYLNAFNDQYDVYVYMGETENIGNLSDYYDFEIEDFASELMGVYGASSYEIYDGNYKFITMEYVDSDYYIIDYYTIIDNKGYIISLQQSDELTDDDRETIREIVDSVVFDNYQEQGNQELIIVGIGIGAVVVLAVAVLIISRIKEKQVN